MADLALAHDDLRDPIDDILDHILSALAHNITHEHNLAKRAVQMQIVDNLLDLKLEKK